MYFEKTKIEFKKIPILPILSYCSVIVLSGFVLKEISNLGNLSYIITTIFLPIFTATINWFTGGNLLKAVRDDWVELPPLVHLLIIIDCLIIFNLIKIIISKELWTKKILNK